MKLCLLQNRAAIGVARDLSREVTELLVKSVYANSCLMRRAGGGLVASKPDVSGGRRT
jgi:hypothetical protein